MRVGGRRGWRSGARKNFIKNSLRCFGNLLGPGAMNYPGACPGSGFPWLQTPLFPRKVRDCPCKDVIGVFSLVLFYK